MSERPERIATEAELDEVLTTPSPELVEAVRDLSSPLVLLGAGGKMGPSLALLARRAADAAGIPLSIVAASRFRDAAGRDWLESHGIGTQKCDVLNLDDLERLPDAANVLYLVGQKFGTQQDPSSTWATNTLAPALSGERYRGSRIVALSTGNVYPLARVAAGGSVESDPLTPLGEYANAAVGRERIFEHCSRRDGTPVVLLRLTYALDLRYGVVADIAGKVHRGEPIPLATGHFTGVWQGDANELILRAFPLAASPPAVFNLSGDQMLSVRDVAIRLGELLDRAPVFQGTESETAVVSNTSRLAAALGRPRTPIETVLRWTADWVRRGGRSLHRPTHFEVRDGAY
ncbi:MAG: NAD(P)-dependent oxidoreductase [Planctomyces sp.]|nr:NAD(P)-dependent oxidoreductase [Planctomyces sp.]